MEYRTLWGSISITLILGFYPERVETKWGSRLWIDVGVELENGPRGMERGQHRPPAENFGEAAQNKKPRPGAGESRFLSSKRQMNIQVVRPRFSVGALIA
jgi:hypothetical protein